MIQAIGVEGGETLEKIADLGVTLLLFSIGLKLRLGSLAKPEIWAGASIHMIVTVIVFGAGTYVLSSITQNPVILVTALQSAGLIPWYEP